MSLLITFLLGIFILAGAFIARSARNRKLIEQISISVAFGTMIALAVTELFPLFFRKFHSTHSNFCVQQAQPPEGGARSRRIVFELYSICARRRARGQ